MITPESNSLNSSNSASAGYGVCFSPKASHLTARQEIWRDRGLDGFKILKERCNFMKDQNQNVPPPSGLSEPSRKFWQEVQPGRANSFAEQSMLAIHCELLDQIAAIEAKLQQEGLTKITARTGAQHAHPLLAIQIQLRGQVLKMEKEFRFAKPEDPLAQLLRKKNEEQK